MAASTTTATTAPQVPPIPSIPPIHAINIHDIPILHLPDFLNAKARQAIDNKAATLSWKGAAKGVLRPEGSGVFQDYENCTIYASKDASGNWQAAEVHGFILLYHRSIGGGKSIVGCPVTDETGTGDAIGRFNSFQNGSIYWTPGTGAHEIYGNILKRWRELGAERSWLGYPLTGELGYVGGRLNSFEHGQIHWENGRTSTVEFKNTILGKYNGIGGIASPLGLPSNISMPVTRSGNSMLMSFRGGTITQNLNEPAPAAVATQTLQIVWVGLECQVKQESNDELSGAISLVVPSTAAPPFVQRFGDANNKYWQLGQPNERIMPTNVVIYNGPPANVIITTELIELDHSAGNPLAVTDKIAGVLKGGADVLKTAGGLAGSDVLSGYGREVGTVVDTYKQIETSSIFQEIVKIFDSADDPYPAGVLSLDWAGMAQRSTPKKVLHRSDDPHSLVWTESITVSARDGGDDLGVYVFYFNVNVTSGARPL